MKGNSRKRSGGSSSKQHSHSRREESGGDRYRNALKERPYRDSTTAPAERSRERGGEARSRDKSSRPEQQRKDRGHTKQPPKEESYEELSRKKRKIESQLEALDMEEAAERKKAEEKKSSEKSRKRAPPPPPRIKEEPQSDNDTNSRRRKNNNTNSSKQNNVDRRRPQPPSSSSSSSSDDNHDWGQQKATTAAEKPKEKPNFAVSGKLAEDTNTYNGVVIKYNEPSEARKPQRRWRLYPFKGDTEMPFIPIHRQSAYLFGRTRSIADIPIDHPSCSKQHAVLQFRLIPYTREDGTKGRRVRPYIIDLESSNGTFVNNKKIDARCYVELMEKDVVKFGFSTREYVVLHEESRNEEEDDDITDSN